jgi:hypothetical protein
MRRGSLRLIKFTLVVASIAFTLLVFEGALRFLFYLRHIDIRTYQPSFIYGISLADRSRFSSHPFLPWAPRPFDSRKLFVFRPTVNRIVEYDINNNSLGFRTPDRPFTKLPNTKRILTLGGSTTVDGPTNDETWPALLERKLNDHYALSGYKIEVINMGVDMAASPTSLVDLALDGVQYQPDLVISYDGVNEGILIGFDDMLPDYRNAMDKYDDTFRTVQSRLPDWAFRSYLITLMSFGCDQLSKKRADVFSQVYPTKISKLKRSGSPLQGAQYFERNLKLMRGISAEYGATFLAATSHWVHPSDSAALLNMELRRFFQSEHIDYVDLDALLEHDDLTIHVDPVHWTLKGLDQVAETWEDKIIKADALKLNQSNAKSDRPPHQP